MKKTIEHKVFQPYGDDEHKELEKILELLRADDFWEVKLVYGGERPTVVMVRSVLNT